MLSYFYLFIVTECYIFTRFSTFITVIYPDRSSRQHPKPHPPTSAPWAHKKWEGCQEGTGESVPVVPLLILKVYYIYSVGVPLRWVHGGVVREKTTLILASWKMGRLKQYIILVFVEHFNFRSHSLWLLCIVCLIITVLRTVWTWHDILKWSDLT